MRTASAVGAETATMMGAPMASGFLHHLDRDAARQQHHALLRGRALARERAGKLVEGVVASDVLTHGNEAAARIEEAGAVHRTGLAVQLLQRKQRVDRRHDLVGGEDKPTPHFRRRAHRLDQALDAAQPASRWPRHLAAAAEKLGCVALFQPDAELDADLFLDDLDALDGVERRDHAFGEAEADGEILEVLRRRHHHRVGRGVEGEGDRRLLRDGAFASRITARAPD